MSNFIKLYWQSPAEEKKTWCYVKFCVRILNTITGNTPGLYTTGALGRLGNAFRRFPDVRNWTRLVPMFFGTFPKTLGPRYEKGKVQLPQRIRNVSRRFVFKTESQPMTTANQSVLQEVKRRVWTPAEGANQGISHWTYPSRPATFSNSRSNHKF